MTLTLAIIIIVSAGIIVLVIFLVKNSLVSRQAALTKSLLNRSMVLKAIRAAKAAVEREPQNAEYHYLLGKAFLADMREEQAFREYRSASRLGINGKNIPETEFRESLASLYTQFHEPDEALKEYIQLIKIHPQNPEYYFKSGMLFTSRNRIDLAEQYFRKAISLNPNDERYHKELGIIYYLAKRIKDASLEFEAAIIINPYDGQSQLYMGKILKDSKDYNGAIPFLEKASRDQEYKLQSLVQLGSCYMSLKMTDKAISDLERAVNIIEKESEPDSLYARYFLAMCYEKIKDYPGAIAQWDKIYTQKKNFRDVGEKLTQYIEYRAGASEKEASASDRML
jgi:tetratricopeptide (TPR) repeat protein